ncbi:MAG: glycosyltransferase [Magnetococcales bacterium]|nr:glycosyltransferase [Magnetococcales bacterium]
MNSPPTISVIMGVYNGERYLDEAIESILKQSFSAFEFIIIDDASTDKTSQILARWAKQDPRLVLVSNRTNLGLTPTLNRGIRRARGEWIARQDADDRSQPDRFTKQMAFVKSHSQVELLGTGAWIIDHQGKREPQPRKLPASHTEICWRNLFHNPFFHTAALFKRSLALQHPYDESVPFAQDFELWGRLLQVTQGANLPEPLIESRRHANRTSSQQYDRQQQIGQRIVAQRFSSLLPEQSWSPEVIANIRDLSQSPWPTEREPASQWLALLSLFRAFEQQPGLDPVLLTTLRQQLLDRYTLSLLSRSGVEFNPSVVATFLRYGGWSLFGSVKKVLANRLVA